MLYPVYTNRRLGLLNRGYELKSSAGWELLTRKGFTISRTFRRGGHVCGLDIYCPQTVRSLFDEGVWHIKFPGFEAQTAASLRMRYDAYKCAWQLATGQFCTRPVVDNSGFVIVNDQMIDARYIYNGLIKPMSPYIPSFRRHLTTDVSPPSPTSEKWGQMPYLQHQRLSRMVVHELKEDPHALYSLSKACFIFSEIVAAIWQERLFDVLEGQGCAHPEHFLDLAEKHGALVSGPALAPVLHPSLEDEAWMQGWSCRMEIHIPRGKAGCGAVMGALKDMGYYLDYDVEREDVKGWANAYLQYPQFGTTVHRIFHLFRQAADGEPSTECIIFENVYGSSALTSVVEQPTTLFMNYAYGGKITILYPSLTLKGQGLINISQWRRQEETLNAILPLRKAGLTVKWTLKSIRPDGHRCGTDGDCPGRIREEVDDVKAELRFEGVDKMRAARERRASKHTTAPYVAWRLRCAASCRSSRFHELSSYAVPRYVVEDVVKVPEDHFPGSDHEDATTDEDELPLEPPREVQGDSALSPGGDREDGPDLMQIKKTNCTERSIVIPPTPLVLSSTMKTKPKPLEIGREWAKLPVEVKIEILKNLRLDHLRRLCTAFRNRDEELRDQVRYALKEKVNDLFARFHLGVSQTWNTMRTTNTILSGSAVLQIIDGTGWEIGDLDFYTPNDQYRRVLAWFKWWGYRVIKAIAPRGDSATWMDAEYGANNCIAGVWVLEHEEYGTMVNVIRSTTSSPFAPLAFFHSTLVMNFISARGVVCAYPKLTLKRKGLMNIHTMPALRPIPQRTLLALVKYQERGYRFVQGQENDTSYNATDPLAYRRWTDKHSTALSFKRDGIVQIKPPTIWRLAFREYRRGSFDDYSPSVKVRGPEGEWAEEWYNWESPERSRMRGYCLTTTMATPEAILAAYDEALKNVVEGFGRQDLTRLSLKDLEHMSQIAEVRKLARQALREKVDRVMRDFHLDPSKTLRMMGRTKTVLSGSAALKVVGGGEWEANDMDFYCPKDGDDDVVAHFKTQGYEVEDNIASDSFASDAIYEPDPEPETWLEVNKTRRILGANNCIKKVLTLKNKTHNTKINVIESRSTSGVAPISFFHSTLVMNFVSGDSVVCGYPELTLNGKGLMNFQTMPPLRPVQRQVKAVVKYQQRGYTFVQGRDEDPTDDSRRTSPPERTWTDGHTLRMAFRRTKKIKPAGDEMVVSWKVSYRGFYADGKGFCEIPPKCEVAEGDCRVTYANYKGESFFMHYG
ncbi:hypothetical protein NMY22_g13503 [Coprinellus aureogranulatus]|nr:hypothetical protein NMY22_g13503 [Coprinellus aureogranulatus]